MKDFEFKTGRNYGAEQVIKVTAIDVVSSDDFLVEFSATFQDSVRGISGRINCISFGNQPHQLADAVMAEYDAGRYEY